MKEKLKVSLGAVVVALGVLPVVWSFAVVCKIPRSYVPMLLGVLGLYLAGAFVVGLGIAVCAEGIKQITASTSD